MPLESWYELCLPETYDYAEIDEDVCDEAGEPLEYFKVNPHLRRARALARKRRGFADRIFSIFSPWPVLSLEAMKIAKSARCCPSFRWVPLDVCLHDGKYVAEYWMAYGAEEHDAWNYQLSECHWIPGRPRGVAESLLYFKSSPVIDLRKMPRLDFFFTGGRSWIVSQDLRDRLLAAGLKGIGFRKLRTSVGRSPLPPKARLSKKLTAPKAVRPKKKAPNRPADNERWNQKLRELRNRDKRLKSITFMRIDGHRRKRIPFGAESYTDKEQPETTCHDCGVGCGELHHPGCDVEQCPACGLQAFICECKRDKDDPWLIEKNA